MTSQTTKTLEAILGTPAPRDLEWARFAAFWKERADDVEEEPGDRLAVRMNGHREVFRRPRDGRVGIDDVERARRLLAASPVAKGEGSLFVVTIDDERARILDFDLDVAGVVDSERRVNDDDTRSRHLRTVQRHTGHDDERDLVQFFDTVAAEIRGISPIPSFVLLGHGTGTSNAAEQFLRRLETAHEDVASHVRAIGTIDLSAASDGEIEKAAESILGGA